jgi:hypothetical protein
VSADPLSPATAQGLAGRLSGYAANGLRYWEPRRIFYIGVLAVVVLGHLVAAWPHVQPRLSFDLALSVFLMAVVANLCYCVVYVFDLFLQLSALEEAIRIGRALLLGVGTAFAATIAHFLAKGMFGV